MIPVKIPARISTSQIETWKPAASGLTPTEPTWTPPTLSPKCGEANQAAV